ncbi:hypothetical protein SDC9_206685 [bioreactor metagenome]|uniref:Uncharacterized protein n=1 Tax=bioreactor metagenome TaxID=1076179 RepID=A0A645J5P0_9ZZZZ
MERLEIHIVLLQNLQDDILAEMELVRHFRELSDLFGGMAQRFDQDRLLIVIDPDLGGC